jgi:hypothetical protein
MAMTGFGAQTWLNLLAGGLNAPTTFTRYLGLFTTAPGDNDAGSVEVSGNAYARVQVAGSLTTNGTTASGNPTLHFAATVPAWIVAGMLIRDSTSPAVIPAGTTVLSTTSTTVTMSANAAGAGVGGTDVITFTAWGAGTSQGPSTATSGAAVTFPQATGAGWGTVNSWGVFDASSAGNLWEWDWLGNNPWYPCSITSAAPGVITAIGITAGSSPTLVNGASVVFTARYGGNLATGLTSETVSTVAGLSADTFNVGTTTSSTGTAMVREITAQPIAANVTASFAAGNLILASA